ncbi:hypothetical protein GOBAR_AA01118 [Gossypium barbadense]|uniref:F-box domain-containing protein n=1 Tax=Gossypium barbadense TaxID=3634 RepID=A0A2P5YV76_GOSBA|nr:hypothetical protein GOBAR_AA01118 [Gossypium barbadense]
MPDSPEPPNSHKTNPNPSFIPNFGHYYRQDLRDQTLKHVIYKMQLHFHRPLSSTRSTSPPSEPDLTSFQSFSFNPSAPDYTSLLSDELLLNILSKLPISQHVSNSLVCKRWLHLHGRLVYSLKVADWSFVTSGRVFTRFPNLTDLDLVRSCIQMPKSSGIIVTHKTMSVHVDTHFILEGFLEETALLPSNAVDQGLRMIAEKYPNLQRLAATGASEEGLLRIAEECPTLQELELHCCGDLALRVLQGLKIYRRLVKLELCGCEGSYDGIKAIGQCCQMLEELTLSEHRMDGGWLAGLSFCGNLKTLRLRSCKSIDKSPGADEHLGSCLTLEELHLQGCQIRDKQSVKALFLVCENVRDIVLHDCWGLEDDVFSLASICRKLVILLENSVSTELRDKNYWMRRVKLLSLEGCSLLTIKGLELVVLSWKELQRLRVMSCNNIKDTEVTPELATLFSVLKELIWRPDSRSLLSSNLAGTGMGRKGDKFFKRSKD